MPLILSIDVSGRDGLVALAKDGIELAGRTNSDPMEHGSFLQPAIQKLLAVTGFSINSLDAIALGNGPGSYTGLRVGLASAKGLCYALSIPLIAISTTRLIAYAAQLTIEDLLSNNDMDANSKTFPNALGEAVNVQGRLYYCPLIDARRLEVFYALYNSDNEPVILPKNEILSTEFLSNHLEQSQILFTGSGLEKWKSLCESPNALFMKQPSLNRAICGLSHKLYDSSSFTGLSTLEPEYCKPFYDAGRA